MASTPSGRLAQRIPDKGEPSRVFLPLTTPVLFFLARDAPPSPTFFSFFSPCPQPCTALLCDVAEGRWTGQWPQPWVLRLGPPSLAPAALFHGHFSLLSQGRARGHAGGRSGGRTCGPGPGHRGPAHRSAPAPFFPSLHPKLCAAMPCGAACGTHAGGRGQTSGPGPGRCGPPALPRAAPAAYPAPCHRRPQPPFWDRAARGFCDQGGPARSVY